MRLLLPLLALALTACGTGASGQPGRSAAPPAAYLVAQNGPVEMTTGTYCWSTRDAGGDGVTACADAMPFEDYPALASADAQVGDTVRLRFGFEPVEPAEAAIGNRKVALTGGRFVVPRTGVLVVSAKAPEGDVSYGIRLRDG